jgi:diguanylate cyclase (GGDEF)-like protein
LGAIWKTPAAGRRIVWLTLIGLAAICGIFSMILLEQRKETLDRAIESASNIAKLIEQDIARNIELYDLSLRGIIVTLDDPDVLELNSKVLQLVLFDQSVYAQDLGALLVLDKDGAVRFDSESTAPRQVDLSNNDYFTAHQKDPKLGLYISRPFKNQLSQDEWVIGFSRRLNTADGDFAGVVLGTMRLKYFRRLLDKVEFGQHSALTLLHGDGTVIMRTPLEQSSIGKNIKHAKLFTELEKAPSGHYETFAAVDGVHRIFAYHQISDLPLVQVVGFSIAEVLAPWRQKAILTSCVLLALCGAVLVLTLRLESALRHRTAAEQACAVLARTDELTGLANRRQFNEALEVEWRRAERDGSAVSLLMLDVDLFKAYNDAYGHLQGDKALCAVAHAIKDHIGRPADLGARYGGEEFAVLLPATDDAGAYPVAETIRSAIEKLGLPHAASPNHVLTVSIGIASLRPRFGADAADLVKAADKALYLAKQAGRNRIYGQQQAVSLVRCG